MHRPEFRGDAWPEVNCINHDKNWRGVMSVYSGIAKKMASWLGILSCFGFLLFFSKLSYSAVQAPRIVDVGVYLVNIPSVNLKEKNFQADFYV